MKVVLLSAGRSVRMQPVSDKNFLKFCGKPLIEHQIEALKKAGFKEILVVGGKHNLVQLKKLAREFKNAKISIAEQKNLDLGMAGAVLTAANWIGNDPFLVVSANDVVDLSAYELVKKNIKKGEGLLVAKKVSQYFPGGYLKLDGKGIIKTIVEKPAKGKEPSKLVNVVIHYHPTPKALFENLKREIKNGDANDMYERALQSLFDVGIVYRAVPFSDFWQPIKYPWHVLDLMNWFFDKCNCRGKNVVLAPSAKIEGAVFLDDGVRVMDNAVIVGPAYIGKNSVIATNALVRSSHVGENCVIGFGSEIARSYIGDNVWTHANYIGDSIIGNNVSFGSGAVTGNLRLDEKNILVNVNGDKIDSGRNKIGLITGDNIRAGINASFMPGVKLGSNSFIGAGIVVGQDIPGGSYVTGKWELKIKPNSERIDPRGKSL